MNNSERDIIGFLNGWIEDVFDPFVAMDGLVNEDILNSFEDRGLGQLQLSSSIKAQIVDYIIQVDYNYIKPSSEQIKQFVSSLDYGDKV